MPEGVGRAQGYPRQRAQPKWRLATGLYVGSCVQWSITLEEAGDEGQSPGRGGLVGSLTVLQPRRHLK